MTKNRRSGLVFAAIYIVFFLVTIGGCSDNSPNLYCYIDRDTGEYEDTGLTLKQVMKRLEKKDISYKYDEKNRILEFTGIKIYFEDYASGLIAYKATQHQKGMDFGMIKTSDAEILLKPCLLFHAL